MVLIIDANQAGDFLRAIKELAKIALRFLEEPSKTFLCTFALSFNCFHGYCCSQCLSGCRWRNTNATLLIIDRRQFTSREAYDKNGPWLGAALHHPRSNETVPARSFPCTVLRSPCRKKKSKLMRISSRARRPEPSGSGEPIINNEQNYFTGDITRYRGVDLCGRWRYGCLSLNRTFLSILRRPQRGEPATRE